MTLSALQLASWPATGYAILLNGDLAVLDPPIGRFIPLNPRDGAELAFPASLDVRGEWEDNREWSGTSRQVRTRTPFEP
jgi:hypothetical protein